LICDVAKHHMHHFAFLALLTRCVARDAGAFSLLLGDSSIAIHLQIPLSQQAFCHQLSTD
jgi:hypothetical protein